MPTVCAVGCYAPNFGKGDVQFRKIDYSMASRTRTLGPLLGLGQPRSEGRDLTQSVIL